MELPKMANGCHNCKKFKAVKAIGGVIYTCSDDTTEERKQETHEIIESKLKNNVMHTCDNHKRKSPEQIEVDRNQAKEDRLTEYNKQMEQFSRYITDFCNLKSNGHRLGGGLHITKEALTLLCANILHAGAAIDENFRRNLTVGFVPKQVKRLFTLLSNAVDSKEVLLQFHILKTKAETTSEVEIVEDEPEEVVEVENS